MGIRGIRDPQLPEIRHRSKISNIADMKDWRKDLIRGDFYLQTTCQKKVPRETRRFQEV